MRAKEEKLRLTNLQHTVVICIVTTNSVSQTAAGAAAATTAAVAAGADANSVQFANSSCASHRLVRSFPFPQIRVNGDRVPNASESICILGCMHQLTLGDTEGEMWGSDATFEVQRPAEDGF